MLLDAVVDLNRPSFNQMFNYPHKIVEGTGQSETQFSFMGARKHILWCSVQLEPVTFPQQLLINFPGCFIHGRDLH